MGSLTEELSAYKKSKRIFEQEESDLKAKIRGIIIKEIIPSLEEQCEMKGFEIKSSDYRICLGLDDTSLTFQVYSYNDNKFYEGVNRELETFYDGLKQKYGLTIRGYRLDLFP
ncbi:MAG: hypothetical protein Q8R18_02060 [bacterium]|nr:hypothetical protein [bacterium]